MSGLPALDISGVLPAFNEETNLERSVAALERALKAHAAAHEIIVVDDGSSDGTASVLRRLETSQPELRVVSHVTNQGYGAALRSGFAAARLAWIFFMDADNQFDPAEIGLLTARAPEADIVAGYRRVRRDPWVRRLNAWAFFTLAHLFFGSLARDVNCAFKLIRRELIVSLPLQSTGALINTELLVLARRCGARVVEVPVSHFPRASGRQTGANPRVVLRAFRELVRLKASQRRRP